MHKNAKCASHRKNKLTKNADMTVVTEASMNPSQVFFGDYLINGVLPKKNPKKYAAMSLITTSVAGRRNLHAYLTVHQERETRFGKKIKKSLH